MSSGCAAKAADLRTACRILNADLMRYRIGQYTASQLIESYSKVEERIGRAALAAAPQPAGAPSAGAPAAGRDLLRRPPAPRAGAYGRRRTQPGIRWLKPHRQHGVAGVSARPSIRPLPSSRAQLRRAHCRCAGYGAAVAGSGPRCSAATGPVRPWLTTCDRAETCHSSSPAPDHPWGLRPWRR